jgi:hypothetical protein
LKGARLRPKSSVIKKSPLRQLELLNKKKGEYYHAFMLLYELAITPPLPLANKDSSLQATQRKKKI